MTDAQKALIALEYIQHDWQQKDGRSVFDEQCEEIRTALQRADLAIRPSEVTVEYNADHEQSELGYVISDAIDCYDTTTIGGRLLAANHIMKIIADKYPNGIRIIQ